MLGKHPRGTCMVKVDVSEQHMLDVGKCMTGRGNFRLQLLQSRVRPSLDQNQITVRRFHQKCGDGTCYADKTEVKSMNHLAGASELEPTPSSATIVI